MESSQRNQYHYFSTRNEVQEQDQDRSRNTVSSNFSNGNSSHDHHRGDHVHLQTSFNNQQFPANRIILNPQAGGPIGLNLTKSPSLIKKLELISTKKNQRKRHQEELAHDQPKPSSKAIHVPAVFLKIGSWEWVSNERDLVAKFYYKRKKLIWEFIYGGLKKKIEIEWDNISAINAFVGEDKKGGIKIELNEQPLFFQENNFRPGKHTSWETSKEDFTEGQASVCRRHTIVFLPGVLDEAFKMLLQCDSRLLRLSRQPFPTHNSQILDFENNTRVVHGSCSVPAVSNYRHQGTFIPPVQNLVQPTTTSFVGHSNSNLPMPDLKFSNPHEVSVGVSFKNQTIDGIWEQSGNSQVQQISFPPNGDQQVHLLPNHGDQESLIPDQDLGMHLIDFESLAEFTNSLSWIPDLPDLITDIHNPNDQFANKQNCFKIESNCKPFKENHQMMINNGFTFNNADQSHFNTELAFKEDSSWKPMENMIHDSSSVKNHTVFEDDQGLCSIDHDQLGFDNRFAFMEPSYWPSCQFSTQDFNNGGNYGMMNQNTDSRNLQSFDPSGGNGEVAFQNPNSGASNQCMSLNGENQYVLPSEPAINGVRRLYINPS